LSLPEYIHYTVASNGGATAGGFMDSRERTWRSLNFEEPDRVPRDFWASEGYRKKAGISDPSAFDAFLDAHDIDLRYIQEPRYVGPPLAQSSDWVQSSDGSGIDIWGVRRRAIATGAGADAETYMEMALAPLASAASVDEIHAHPHWPSLDWFDYSDIAAQCVAVHAQGRVAVFQGDRMNRVAQLKPAMYLRGIEQIFMDMIAAPVIAAAIIEHVRAFYTAYAERIFDAANGQLDLLLTGDDFGGQHGPLISPAMWELFIGQGFAEYIAIAKAHGVRVMHHTCGAVRPLIPLMIARGLDVLQSLQPEADGMDACALKRDFGNRLAFHGGLSIQQTLPFGTPDDVRREVRDKIEALAPGGGYIVGTAHNIQADTSVENVNAMLETIRQFGNY
jgi:uroporphyrinogen decarboxylase